MEYAVVYSVSAIRDLISLTIQSIQTLKQFIPESRISLIFTRPFKAVKEFNTLDILYRENLGKEIYVSDHTHLARYIDKLYLCDCPSENVLFLDCDTRIQKSPLPLFDGDFDFGARFEHGLPNAGALIFKHSFHKKIKEVWLEKIKGFYPYGAPRDEISLRNCLGDARIKELTSQEHGFLWVDSEEDQDSIIIHGRKRSYRHRLKKWVNRFYGS